ncbi:MAG: hypothetical protein R2799_05845 [Crocinitomicaceae bacterium]
MKKINILMIASVLVSFGFFYSCKKEISTNNIEKQEIAFTEQARIYDASGKYFVDITFVSNTQENLDAAISVYNDCELKLMTSGERADYFEQFKQYKPEIYSQNLENSVNVSNVDLQIDWSDLKTKLNETGKNEFMLIKKQNLKITWLPWLPIYGGSVTVTPAVDGVNFLNTTMVTRFGQGYTTATANVHILNNGPWANGLNMFQLYTYYSNNGINGIFLGGNYATWPTIYYTTNLQGQVAWGIN